MKPPRRKPIMTKTLEDAGRRSLLKMTSAAAAALAAGCATSQTPLDGQWDKTFAKSDKVDHRKITFKNRYGITLAGDLYQPKNPSGKRAAIAVGGPFGAVKEQSSGL